MWTCSTQPHQRPAVLGHQSGPAGPKYQCESERPEYYPSSGPKPHQLGGHPQDSEEGKVHQDKCGHYSLSLQQGFKLQAGHKGQEEGGELARVEGALVEKTQLPDTAG